MPADGVAAGALPPGATLGVLGGGQLGRMFTLAARTMGYRVVVLDPDPQSPAGAVADVQQSGTQLGNDVRQAANDMKAAGSEAAASRLRREAEAAAAVCNPHVTSVLADGLGSSEPHLVLPYLEGVSLRGLDNRTYYRLVPGDPRRYQDPTGCGNALAADRPPEELADEIVALAGAGKRLPRHR